MRSSPSTRRWLMLVSTSKPNVNGKIGLFGEVLDGLGPSVFGKLEIPNRQILNDRPFLSRTVASTLTTLTPAVKVESLPSWLATDGAPPTWRPLRPASSGGISLHSYPY